MCQQHWKGVKTDMKTENIKGGNSESQSPQKQKEILVDDMYLTCKNSSFKLWTLQHR